MASLVEELQAEALSRDIKIDDLLRKAKVVAEKLDVDDMRVWVDHELNGYPQTSEIPEYRKIHCEFHAEHPYHGWQRVHFTDPEKTPKWLFEPRSVTNPAGQVDVDDPAKGFEFKMSPELKARFMEAVPGAIDARCMLNRSEILGIQQIVRNRILDWALRLDKVGIRGEGLSFSATEKQQAQTVTNTINVSGNVGNLSNVVGVGEGASVETNQSNATEIDVRMLMNVMRQLRENAGTLVPADRREDLIKEITIVEEEAKNSPPNAGKLRSALSSAKKLISDAVSDAGATLISQGALSLIAQLLHRL